MDFRACNQPWIEMQLLYTGRYRTCCYYEDELTYDHLDIPSIWRSGYFKHIRQLIAGGDPTGSYCERCDYTKYYENPLYTVIPNYVTGERRRNWERALKHQADGVIDIDTYPVKYYMQFGMACNLRCIMCNHPQRYAGGEDQELSADSMLRMAEYLQLAESIHVIGGEPLIIPNAVRFLEGVVANPRLWDLRYDIYTNGLPLNKFTERLLPLERIDITASIDSSGEYYDAIRVRSSWEQVTRNLEGFVDAGRKHGKHWNVYVSTVLMKSGLLGLPRLVDWCIANDFSTSFVNIIDIDGLRNDDEHIFRSPELLNEVPGWEAALAECIRLFDRAGRYQEAQRVETAINELKFAAAANEAKRSRTISFNTPVRWAQLFAASGEGLVAQLQQHLYGRNKDAAAIETGVTGLKFTPTSARDHIATDFMETGPAEIDNMCWLRLQYQWSNEKIDPNSCVLDLQDDEFNILEAMQVERTNGAGLGIAAVFELRPDTRVRIRLTLPSIKPGYLPDEIRLERAIPNVTLVAISNLRSA